MSKLEVTRTYEEQFCGWKNHLSLRNKLFFSLLLPKLTLANCNNINNTDTVAFQKN